jgi:hypothetical protein
MQSDAIVLSSSLVNIFPVGLCGVLMRIARVFFVMVDLSSSMGTEKAGGHNVMPFIWHQPLIMLGN